VHHDSSKQIVAITTGHTCYTCKRSLGKQQERHDPSFLHGVVCRTSKSSICSYTHRPALSATARRDRCLATDGSVSARRILPRPPAHPLALPSVSRYARFKQRPSAQAYQQNYILNNLGTLKGLESFAETRIHLLISGLFHDTLLNAYLIHSTCNI
jgi:hypothetical protein